MEQSETYVLSKTDLVFSEHAKLRITERGFTVEEVEEDWANGYFVCCHASDRETHYLLYSPSRRDFFLMVNNKNTVVTFMNLKFSKRANSVSDDYKVQAYNLRCDEIYGNQRYTALICQRVVIDHPHMPKEYVVEGQMKVKGSVQGVVTTHKKYMASWPVERGVEELKNVLYEKFQEKIDNGECSFRYKFKEPKQKRWTDLIFYKERCK